MRAIPGMAEAGIPRNGSGEAAQRSRHRAAPNTHPLLRAVQDGGGSELGAQ